MLRKPVNKQNVATATVMEDSWIRFKVVGRHVEPPSWFKLYGHLRFESSFRAEIDFS